MSTANVTYDFLDSPGGDGELGRLKHYRILRELGRGGMGFVFEAEDVKLKRLVALKVMNQKIAATAGSRQRFLREARAMAAIRHDNVATIFEVGQSGDTPFMAMEMLQGKTLETLNKDGERLGFERIIDFATQITEGLAAAHARGIVHRDIKPANLWVETAINRIKILDFGLALASTPVDSLAGRGSVIGTPGYLSPEQARSEPLDDRSDLYSLGVVLYELCTGKLPIHSKSVHEQLIAILLHKPTPIGELNPEIPGPLCDLIHRLLRKEPRSRVASAEELLKRLAETEEACHRTSEVAQTIDKLKMGLESVVVQKTGPDLDAMPTADPLGTSGGFAALPSMPAPGPALSSGSSGRLPAAAAPVGSGIGRSKGNEPRNPWLLYGPLLAIVGLLVVALPLMTFLFGNVGRDSGNYVIRDDGSRTVASSQPTGVADGNAGGGSSRSNASGGGTPPQNRNQGSGASNASSQPNQAGKRNNPSGSNASGGATKSGSNASNKTSSKSSSEAPKANTPTDNNRNKSNNGDSSSKQAGSGPNSNAIAGGGNALASSTASDSPAGPAVLSDAEMAERVAEKAAINDAAEVPSPSYDVQTIGVNSGDGADALVLKTNPTAYGKESAIGVQTRNNVETAHSYIRFDLQSLGDARKRVRDANLVLTPVGSDAPVGAVVRVYSIDQPIPWPEERILWKGSFSEVGLDSLTQVGETEVTSGGKVRIRIKPLATQISASEPPNVTVVIAGGKDRQMVRFVSREKAAEEAPQLELAIAPPGT